METVDEARHDGVSTGKVLLGILLAGLVLLAIGGASLWYLADRWDDELALPEAPTAADLDVPPSERGSDADREIVAGRGQEGVAYEELRCAFTGESLLDPGLPSDLISNGTAQRMTLTPDSAFECDQNGEATAGKVEMDATFEELDIFSGVAKGTGRIRWDLLPPDEAAGQELARLESSTITEVELAFPEIIVWITITDGPYTGFRGKLVLDRWELIEDGAGDIVGVRFEPTDFRMSTL